MDIAEDTKMTTTDDTHEDFDFGYDLEVQEDAPFFEPPRPETLPSSATVNAHWLPPVGAQGSIPSCFVWGSTYGLATFAAAKAGNYRPTARAQQASPAYTYIQVLIERGSSSGTCQGGQISSCFQFLKANGGTPTMEAAPYSSTCSANWSAYGKGGQTADSAFDVTGWAQFSILGADGLDNLRTMISAGVPLVYGTSLYTDFPAYKGSPSPYVGNGKLLYNRKTGKLVGHVMVIIGYDDSSSAVLIQNSFGTSWGSQWKGSGGYVWMAYDTLQTLAQGSALFITQLGTTARPQ